MLVSYPGVISEKSGWKCIRQEAGKVVYIPFEGYYESKGGRIESPKFDLDKKADETAWYELTFLAKCAEDGFWWVDVYDAAGAEMPDMNSRLYASENWKWYSIVVAAQPGTVAAKLAFVTKKGVQAKDVAFRRISAEKAVRWCHDFAATLPPVKPEVPADAWAKLPRSAAALKAGKPVRILLLGDSIMNDTWCGNVAALIKEKFPNAELFLSVRGSTGCWYYREEKHFDDYVTKYNPDLVLIGGASNRTVGDTDRLAVDSVVEVVRRCRAKGYEVALLSPPPSWQFRRAQDDPYYDGETAGRGLLRRGWQFTAVAEANVAYWDVTTAPCRAMAASRKPLDWFKRDGAHNDDRGKQLIARTLAAYFGVLKGDVAPAAAFRYRWRGFMLDECRHFFGKDVVKKYLDRMAALNLNVFHWHLTEDQAWRLDIPGMPELVKYGATRSSTPTPGNNEDSDGKVYGPYFYTPADVREIVEYAAQRNIRVVPEIELPGHARALLAAHPEFACEGVGPTLAREPWTHFGICKDVLCAGNDEALAFYERVLDEVMKMFPSEFIHIGGDECPKDNWKKCPKCQARIKALGLKDEHALQGWVTTRMANYVASKGRRAIGWDEVLDGADLPKSTVIQSWRGAEGGIAAAKRGHDVIMSPCEWTYFTFAEGLKGDPYKYRPWVRGKFLPAAKMRAFSPEAGVPEEYRHHILGAECCAWSEILCDVEELEYKTLHRLPAFAEAMEVRVETPMRLTVEDSQFSLGVGISGVSERSLAEKVDTREGIGRVSGNCMPGPCLPHASVYPSPDTLWPRKERPGRGAPTNGFYPDDPCVGFSQLHCQGTGGTVTYGLFLVSPTTGTGESEEELSSPLMLRETRPYRFRGRMEKWGCEVALAPTAHGAIYTFDFDSDGGRLVFNAKRKIALPVATSNAVVKVSDDGLTVSGGGTYFGNWNPAPYDCYFHSVQERKGRRITLRIAVSFKNEEKTREYLKKELAGRSLDEVASAAKAIWDDRLSCIEVGGLEPAEETKFYSQLFHAFVQPRDRTGDFAGWGSDESVWDDHYTLWDTWKTLFPLMAIVDPAMVAGNVNSFASRLRRNGTVTAAFIQGREYRVGQGGDEQDNVIADAFAKKISGIDWDGAWSVLEYDAAHRTPEYRTLGWVPYGVGETIRTDYCWRMKSASSTLAFAYNDWCAAQVAKGLGNDKAAAELLKRSANWTNVWDAALVDKESGFRGFIHGRFPDGRFTDIEPRGGFQNYLRPGWKNYWGDFYEGSAWMYSYNVWHDLPRLIELMGGREKFLERLNYAFDNDLIEYGNEPNFMTPWLFDFVGRPDLAGKWAHRFLEKYPRGPYPSSGSPGDDDSGAMGSMYVFLTAGLYPIAGQDIYALHAPAAERIRFHLPASGKDFTIFAPGARRGRSSFKSVKLNGNLLEEPFIRHADLLAGGTLSFEL